MRKTFFALAAASRTIRIHNGAARPMSSPRPFSAPSPRRLVLALGTSQLLSWGTAFYVPAVIAIPAAQDIGITPAAALGGFSWALLITGFCAPQVGRYIGRHGGRAPLAVSTLVLAAGLALMASAHGLIGWYAGWTLMGVGMALGLYDAAFATAGSLLGASVGPTITGITLIAGFASTVGWPAGSAMLPALGWRGTLLVYAAVQLVVNLPLLLATIPRGVLAEPRRAAAPPPAGRARRAMVVCMATFFSIRWFITSAVAANVLLLMGGLGLSIHQALIAAMLIGPGQVAGRVLEWVIAPWLGTMARARLGALLFPAGALLLLIGQPLSVYGFALLYGMSNGILTINRGTLPMLVLGPSGYAALLGWLAMPVLLAQAAAPSLTAPLVDTVPAATLFLAAAALAGVASALLLFLRPAPRD